MVTQEARKCVRVGLAILVVLNFSLQGQLLAQPTQGHVVPLEELTKTVTERWARRAENIRDIQQLLRHDEVHTRVGGLVDLDKIEHAIPTLDDETLERLATESRKVDDQLRAGVSLWRIVVVVLVIVGIIIGVAASGAST